MQQKRSFRLKRLFKVSRRRKRVKDLKISFVWQTNPFLKKETKKNPKCHSTSRITTTMEPYLDYFFRFRVWSQETFIHCVGKKELYNCKEWWKVTKRNFCNLIIFILKFTTFLGYCCSSFWWEVSQAKNLNESLRRKERKKESWIVLPDCVNKILVRCHVSGLTFFGWK